MVDKIANTILDQLVENTKDLNSKKSDEKRKANLEKKLTNLLSEKANIEPGAIEALRNEANALGKMAEYTNHLANLLEKNKKQVEKKKLEEVKKTLMEELGVPAEFIEQLAVLVKAGPQALREASAVYKEEADKKREAAAFLTQDLERIDNQIKQVSNIKDNLGNLSKTKNESMKDFLNRKLYEEAIRDNAELELKDALELIAGKQGANKKV